MSEIILKPGDVVQGPYWPEPIEVKLVESFGDYVRIGNLSVVPVVADFAAPAHEVFNPGRRHRRSPFRRFAFYPSQREGFEPDGSAQLIAVSFRQAGDRAEGRGG